jgi:hypothetical protein
MWSNLLLKNVKTTHFWVLFVIGQEDVIRLPYRKCVACHHLLPVAHETRCDTATFQKNAMSLTSCSHQTRYDEVSLPFNINVAHFLLVIWQDVMRLPVSKAYNFTCRLLVVGQDAMISPFRKMCNVTHFLLIIRQNVIRFPVRKCAMSLTLCYSWDKMWWDYLQLTK